MRLRDFEIIADQNIRREVVAWLLSQKLNVASVAAMLDRKAPDEAIVEAAEARVRCAVLTHDRDFGFLVQRGARIVVVYVRPGHLPPESTISQLEAVLDLDVPDEPAVVVVTGFGEKLRVRVRARSSLTTEDARDENHHDERQQPTSTP